MIIMEDFQSNTINSVSQVENYIEFINLQLKNPNTQDIPLNNGSFYEFWKEFPIYNFKISTNSAKKLENIHGDYWIEINGQRKECNLIDISEGYVSIWIKDDKLETKDVIRYASIKIDLGFILKRQLNGLEQFRNIRYENFNKYLFDAEDIPNSLYVDCIFENDTLNEEQKDAIRFGTGIREFYLIWGPPGTGKTTLIPELVVNFKRNFIKENGKEPRILVCSYTNAAVDNVAKRLFGKIENLVRYGETSLRKKELRDKYKKILFEEQVESKKKELEEEFNKKFKSIENEISILQDKINSHKEQLKTFRARREEIQSKVSGVESEIADLQNKIGQGDKKFKLLKGNKESVSLKYGNINAEIEVLKKKMSHEDHIFNSSLYKRIFHRSKHMERMVELQRQYDKLLLQRNNLNTELKNIEQSIIFLNSEWSKKKKELQSQLNRLLLQKNELDVESKNIEKSIPTVNQNLSHNKEEIITIKNKQYTLTEDRNQALRNIEIKILNENFTILTTNLRTANSIFDNFNFDLTIMDEAGAIDLPSAVMVLIRSSKVVFVGDHKQLSPIISDNSDELKSFLRKHPKIKYSIFEILYKNNYETDRLIMLENQYRMKREIANFISTQFYNGRIKTPSEISGVLKNTDDKILSAEYPVVFFKRNFPFEYDDRSSVYNLFEIKFIKNIIAKFEHEYGEGIKQKISIITPYRAQLEHLIEEIPDVDCGTVHRYQGQEKDIVIFSTARYKKGANGFGHLFQDKDGENLLNVAMSRAREKFIIIGGYALYQNVKVYNELFKYIENNGLIIKEQVPGYDDIILNKCLMCGEKIKFNQIRCPDCEQLHKMQTFLEEKPREWKCIDGDLVRSNDETLIDNWLNHNNIKHQVEMKIPIQQLRYCDWYIPDYEIYIEFWGDVHTKYPEARKVKEKLYQKNKLKLVNIEPENLKNLDEILKYKLKLKGMIVENVTLPPH